MQALVFRQGKAVGHAGDVIADGEFQMLRGQIAIVGRRLTFQRGTISFVGNFDPVLDFQATSQANSYVRAYNSSIQNWSKSIFHFMPIARLSKLACKCLNVRKLNCFNFTLQKRNLISPYVKEVV